MIAHIDADSFFASVLVRQHPHLRGKPLLAMGMGGGCVIAASYEAKAKGVKTGMPLKEAKRLCPEAIRMRSDFREAGLASEQIEKIIRDTCPVIEQMSIDEWYLDIATLVGGTPLNPGDWASRIQKQILKATALSVSVGVGPTKLLAKMSGEYRKPSGVTVIADTNGINGDTFAIDPERFLRDRPAAAIPGIGRKNTIHAQAEGWETAWDIAMAPTEKLIERFGRPGADIQSELLGTCLSPVNTVHAPPKSVSRARSFRREIDAKLIWAHTLRHLEYVILKMRRHGLAARGVSVWLRDDKYLYDSAHASLPQPLATEEAIQPYARRCLRQVFQARHGYTQVGLALWRLSADNVAIQYSLFDEPLQLGKGEDMQRTLDALHERFGRNAITKGAAMQVKTGTAKLLGLPIYE